MPLEMLLQKRSNDRAKERFSRKDDASYGDPLAIAVWYENEETVQLSALFLECRALQSQLDGIPSCPRFRDRSKFQRIYHNICIHMSTNIATIGQEPMSIPNFLDYIPREATKILLVTYFN